MGKGTVKKGVNKEIMEIVQKYIETISKHYKLDAAILFGSYAKGTQHEDSDIDIAIIIDIVPKDVFEEELKLMKLRWEIDLRIEPHIITTEDYNNVSTPFAKEVIDTGIKVA